MKKKVILRADANPEIGFGHVIRLVALAEILGNEQFIFDFYSDDVSVPLRDEIARIANAHFTTDRQEKLFFDNLRPGETVVIDGYSFNEDYQMRIRSAGCTLVCIDDLHDKFYHADAVINHAGGATADMYRTASYTRLYLGLQYCLLRKEFVSAAAKPRAINAINHVLVSFGGASSSAQFASRVVHRLVAMNCFEVINILLGSEPDQPLPKNHNVRIHRQLDAKAVCRLMTSCDLAIVPASNLSLEAYAVGLFIMTGLTATNQNDIYAGYRDIDFVFPVGDFENPDTRWLEKGLQYFNALPKPFTVNRSATDINKVRNIFNDITHD